MEIETLSKEDFKDAMRGEPTVRFTHSGVVFFNKAAVKHLGLKDKVGFLFVQICRDLKVKSDFAVFKDTCDGWQLRDGHAGGALFNSVGLARHVIDATWERCVSHPVGAEKPGSVVFLIAKLPLDDDKNKDVYALLRKREC